MSAERFPGHFGIGGLARGEKMLDMFFRMTGISSVFDVAMEEVVPGELRLTDGRRLPFKYAMIVPPFIGAEVVMDSGIGNARGFIDVKDTYQTLQHPNVYAVGIAAAVDAPWRSANAVGVPKTGFPIGDDGPRSGDEHRLTDPRRRADTGGELRRHARRVRHGRREQRGSDPGRPDASAKEVGRDDPGSAEPSREARLRTLLPLEDPQGVRTAAVEALRERRYLEGTSRVPLSSANERRAQHRDLWQGVGPMAS